MAGRLWPWCLLGALLYITLRVTLEMKTPQGSKLLLVARPTPFLWVSRSLALEMILRESDLGCDHGCI